MLDRNLEKLSKLSVIMEATVTMRQQTQGAAQPTPQRGELSSSFRKQETQKPQTEGGG